MIYQIYQILGVIIGITAIIISLLRFKDGRMSVGMFLFWMVVWLIVIMISVYPQSTTFFANIIGIGRGLDLALILGIIGCYYLIFKTYTKIEKLEENLTLLVREIAIQREDLKHKNKQKSQKHDKNTINDEMIDEDMKA
jgi:hypothetical protein